MTTPRCDAPVTADLSNVTHLPTADAQPTDVADTDAIRLGGGFRLPAQTADTDKVRLGGGFRLPAVRTQG